MEFVSPESKDGVYYKKSSFFRKYESPQAFLKDYAIKIRTDYPLCTADNVWGYFAGLYKGRWASGALAGAFAFYVNDAVSYAGGASIGFRLAFFLAEFDALNW